MDRESLIRKCIRGEAVAQRRLFDSLAPKMLSICIRYLGNKEEAEDVCQISFVKLFSNLKDYNNEGSFDGWVRRIFVNTCLDQLRKNKKTKYDVPMDDVDYRLENNDYILERMEAADLMKIVEQMPPGYRTVFNLFAVEGYSHREIAERLEIAENTSKSQFKRARTHLMNSLEKLQYGK
jgi:RNA polymerase sigma factor (sigma-70 family)|tara:strand:+ start:8191 stop:8727 length:537 start_codon:yes stop_codon:yes gene_type:complete